MNKQWPKIQLRHVLSPCLRSEAVDPLKEYRLLGVRLGGQGPFLRETVAGSQSAATTLYRVAKGDFIYSRLFACRGAFGVIPDEFSDCYVSAEFPTFTAVLDRIDVEFLRYWFRLAPVIARVNEDCTGSTPLTRNRFKEEFFLALEIPLPPLTEQRRVVARIEELAAQINETRALRRQSAKETDALLNKVTEAIFDGQLPQARLDELCSLITDGTHQTPRYVEDGHTFLSAQNVKPFRFMPEQHRRVSIEDYQTCIARAKPQKGDVLLTRVGAGIGEAAVIDRKLDFAFYVSLALLRPIPERILPEFLVHWLNAPNGRAQSRRQTLGRGHSQGNLNLKLLRGFQLPAPALSEQFRIVAELDALQAEVDGLKRLQVETSAELDALLPAILDRAFRGEL